MKVFFPTCTEDVAASAPHPPNTMYRVSRGNEHWGDGDPYPVLKVQMVYGGAVSGRRSPSYPIGTDDYERVLAAMERVRRGRGTTGRGEIAPV